MSQFLMLCTLVLVTEGLASTVPEQFRYLPAIPGATPSCVKDDQHYCEDVENYPEETIQKLLQTAPPELIELLSKDNQYQNESEVKSHNSSMVGDELGVDLCESLSVIMKPRAVRTVHNEWRYVVNAEGYNQITRARRCSQTDTSCLSYLKLEYQGKCVQKYFIIKVVVLHPSGERLSTEPIQVPSCCSCTTNVDRAEKL